MQKTDFSHRAHYRSRRFRLYLLFILIFLMVILSGCGAVTTVDTKFKGDGSGTVSMKADVSASDLANLSGGAEALKALLESKKPSFLTIESQGTSSSGDWAGTFSFAFKDTADLQTKLQTLTENPQLALKYQSEGTGLSGKLSYDQGFSDPNAYWNWAQTLIKNAGILSSNYDSVIIDSTDTKFDFDPLTADAAAYIVQDQPSGSGREVSLAIPAPGIDLQLDWSKKAVDLNWTLNVKDKDLAFMKTLGLPEIGDTLQKAVGQNVTLNKESKDGHTILKWSFKGRTPEELNAQGGKFIKFDQVAIQKTGGGSWYYPEYTASIRAELPFFQSALSGSSNSSAALETTAQGTITSQKAADHFDPAAGITQSLTFQAPNVWAFVITGILILILIAAAIWAWIKRSSLASLFKGRSPSSGPTPGGIQGAGNEQAAATDEQAAAADTPFSAQAVPGPAYPPGINSSPSSSGQLKGNLGNFLKPLALRPKLGIAVIAILAVLSGYLLGGIFSIAGSAVLQNTLGEQAPLPGGFSYFAASLYSPFHLEGQSSASDLGLISQALTGSSGQTKLDVSVPLLGLSLLVAFTMVFWGALVERLRSYGGRMGSIRFPFLIYGGIYALITVLLSELLAMHMAVDIPLLGSLTVSGGNEWPALLINSFLTASACGWIGSKLAGKRRILRPVYRAWFSSQSFKVKNFIQGVKTSGLVFIVLSVIAFLAVLIWNAGGLSGSFGVRLILAVALAPVAAVYALYLLLFGRASLGGSWTKVSSLFDQLSGSAQSSVPSSLGLYFSHLNWIIILCTLLITAWLIFSAIRNYRGDSPLGYALSFGLGFSSVPIIGSLLAKAAVSVNGSSLIVLKISPLWNWFLIFILSAGIAFICSYLRSRKLAKDQ